MNIEVKNTGNTVDYSKSMNILEKRAADVLSGKKKELLWIIEHNSVYTAGTSSKNEELLNKNVKVIKTNRGGKYTFHGPGQKVIYFVLNLNKRGRNIKKLINNIECCIKEILREYKINSFADKRNIGIWVGDDKNPKKIAAIGIKVKKWIAYHGFSLNINNKLSPYEKIVPCGLKDRNITNLKNIRNVNYNNLEKKIIKNFINYLKT